MSSNGTVSALQPHHVNNLIQILRRANYHYSALAARIRTSLRPTHHARSHATKLGLGVDIEKAVHLDHRQVSVIPLPIIEQVVSPRTCTLVVCSQDDPPVINCVIPAWVHVGPAVSPKTATVSGVHAHGDDSKSGLSTKLGVRLLSPLELTPIVTEDQDSPEHDAPVSAGLEQDNIRLFRSSRMELKEPDAPIDEVEDDWELDESSEGELASCPSTSSQEPYYNSTSSASTSGCSAGLLTPDMADDAPLVVRIKRKWTEIREDMEVFERRPKFERKEWLVAATERPTIKIPPVPMQD